MLTFFRRVHFIRRLATAVLAVVFLFTHVSFAHAQGQSSAAALPQVVAAVRQPDTVPRLLARLKEEVQAKRRIVGQRIADGGIWERVATLIGVSALALENTGDIDVTLAALDARHAQELAQFDTDLAELQKKNLSPAALERATARVAQARAAYLAGHLRLLHDMAAVQASESLDDQKEALDRVGAFLDGQSFERSQEPFDPETSLPFGPVEPAHEREPDVTPDPVSALKSPVQRTAERLIGTIGDALISPAHATFVPPGAADQGESQEITLSPAIRAKAAELHNNPVEIYNWVRNNVEWVPTYGSVQDADATLAAQRGNAFAVSSLLIALLRAAGVSARYAYGVIEVPMAQAQNWVGGTTHPNAALSVLYQGGIPNAGVVEGGRLTAVRMEHIWVEAFVDFVPSRGAKNIQPDTWVALDASFKQYNHTAGYDLATHVPFDVEGLINDLQASATRNESEGWVQNVDQTLIQQRFDQYRAQVENYITNANPDATVGEVLGTRQTIVFAPMQLASGLPYTLQAVTARYSEIPQPLRHTYRVTLAEKTPLAQSTGATVIDVSIPLSVVTRRALALSFVPATQADEEVLLSYLSQDGDSNLPTELPGYLIDMKAQLTLDGEVVGEGGVFPMGTELNLTHYFTDPRRTVKPVSSNVIAGEYHAIGVDGGQINLNLLAKTKAQLDQAKTELEAIKTQLDNNQTPAISDFLTKHTLTGNLLQTGILGYFAINDSLDQLDARSMGVVTQRLPSFGTFATSLEPQYLFGSIPRNVKLAGLSMDVDRFSTLAMAQDGSNLKNIVFFRATGPRKSAFEHLVPEQLFSTAEAPAQAVSAVKALAIAAQQGQKIYTLTKANAAQLNTLTISQTAKTDIAAALNANKEVTVHQGPITYAGWTGEGYAVLDPSTGAGAYKISGGGNGAEGLYIAIGFFAIGAIVLAPILLGLGAVAITLGVIASVLSFNEFKSDLERIAKIGDRKERLNQLGPVVMDLLLRGASAVYFGLAMREVLAMPIPRLGVQWKQMATNLALFIASWL